MKDHGLLFGWKRPVPGKEGQALELYGTCLEYYAKKKNEGVIDSFEPVLLGNVGGNLGGFFLIRGETEKLAALRHDEEFLTLLIRGGILLEDLCVVDAYFGESITKLMETFRKSI